MDERNREHGLELIGVDDARDDYIAHLRRPDGVVIKVLIPREGSIYDRMADWDGVSSPYGLNLVCDGHYT